MHFDTFVGLREKEKKWSRKGRKEGRLQSEEIFPGLNCKEIKVEGKYYSSLVTALEIEGRNSTRVFNRLQQTS